MLLENGWRGQYLGKFHSPYSYTQDDSGKSYFSKPVMWSESEGLKLLVLSVVTVLHTPLRILLESYTVPIHPLSRPA